MVNISHYNSKNKIIVPFIANRNNSTATPITVEIHMTNKCNYRCSYCAFKDRNLNGAQLSGDVLRDLIKDLVEMDVKSVYISGGGEPTLHEDFEFVANELHANGINIALLTNGSQIDKIVNIADRFDYILVHISMSEFTNDNNSDISTNETHLSSMIKARGVRTLIGAKIIITNDIMDHIPSKIEELLEKSFDYVICASQNDYEQSGKIVVDEDRLNLLEGHEIFKYPNVMITNKAEIVYKETETCYFLKNKMHAIIAANGDVSICTPNASLNSDIIGNLAKDRFRDIWNSDDHNSVINKMSEKYYSGKCRLCRSIKYNSILHELEKQKYNPHAFFL